MKENIPYLGWFPFYFKFIYFLFIETKGKKRVMALVVNPERNHQTEKKKVRGQN